MKGLMLGAVAVSALTLTGFSAAPASARDFAVHVSGRGYHFDIGRSHGHYRHSYGDRHRSSHGWHGRGHRHRDHVWHDTSHFDYYPGGYVRHYDHYDYVPGHWRFHRDGHWDHLHR
jgi:hypothetical protein